MTKYLCVYYRNHINEALCLNYLSMAYQELGEWDQAQETITQSANLIDRQLLNLYLTKMN